MFYAVRIPAWFRKLNPSITWNITAQQNALYLTFDDGPHEKATPFVLDQLKQFNAKATFFCIGKNVKAHPDIYRRILEEGHSVGNHTFSHLDGWKTKSNAYIQDIHAASEYIRSDLFRPPYGKISPFTSKLLRKKFSYKIIMWEVLSGDFDVKLSPQKCAENVLRYSKAGSIIVFHDSTKAWDRMSYALPKLLQVFSEKGFCFKAIKN